VARGRPMLVAGSRSFLSTVSTMCRKRRKSTSARASVECRSMVDESSLTIYGENINHCQFS
jgi:hypothetical protein